MNIDTSVGLTSREVAERLAEDGPNELSAGKRRTLLTMAVAIVKEPMTLLLLVCGGIYLVLGDVQESIMLLGFVLFIMGITLVQERNRMEALRHRPTVIASVRERSERWVVWCEAEIAALDAELTTLLDQAGEWHAAADRLRSVPGIGPITAGWLLVETLAFTTCATPTVRSTSFRPLSPMSCERMLGS